MTTVLVVGAGRMGSALVRALLNEQFPVHVWNRTRERSEALARSGAQLASSIEHAAQASEVVIVNVLDYEAANSLLRTASVAAALKGKALVQVTSGSPEQARESGQWAREHGIAYLDGAIMATPNFIGSAGGTTLYAGSRAIFDQHQQVLHALGTAAHVGEDVGHASALDIALLSQMWGTLFGTLQATAVCEAEGLDLITLDQHWKPFKPIVDAARDDLLTRVRERRYRADATTLASIAAHYSAFQHLLSTAQTRGLNPVLPAAFDGLFKAAIGDGYLTDDFAALAPYLARRP